MCSGARAGMRKGEHLPFEEDGAERLLVGDSPASVEADNRVGELQRVETR